MATGKIQVPISVVEEGTTTDNTNEVWNYRKYSNGDIDLWFTGSLILNGTASTVNGIKRKIEDRTISILTDVSYAYGCAQNTGWWCGAAIRGGVNNVVFYAFGIQGDLSAIGGSFFIRGRWV